MSDRDRDIAGLIKALQDEREKRQAKEAEAAELRAWRAEQERRRQEAARQAPPLLEDPEAWEQWALSRARELARKEAQQIAQRQVQDILLEERVASSEEKWREKLGGEWDQFLGWVQKAPQQFHDAAFRNRDPYGWAHQEYERQKRLHRATELEQKLSGKSLDDYIQEQVQAKLAEAQAQAPQGQPRTPQGQFAAPETPPKKPQRHTPPSVANINGSAAARPGRGGRGLDAILED